MEMIKKPWLKKILAIAESTDEKLCVTLQSREQNNPVNIWFQNGRIRKITGCDLVQLAEYMATSEMEVLIKPAEDMKYGGVIDLSVEDLLRKMSETVKRTKRRTIKAPPELEKILIRHRQSGGIGVVVETRKERITLKPERTSEMEREAIEALKALKDSQKLNEVEEKPSQEEPVSQILPVSKKVEVLPKKDAELKEEKPEPPKPRMEALRALLPQQKEDGRAEKVSGQVSTPKEAKELGAENEEKSCEVDKSKPQTEKFEFVQRAMVVLELEPSLAKQYWIGRDVTCDLRLDDMQVSRRHCFLSMVNGVFFLQDGGTTNGSYVNGSRVKRNPICEGDMIQVGNTVMLVRFLSE